MNSFASLLTRLGTMSLTLVCGVLTTRLIISEGGVADYALYSVLVAIPALLPFTDLGTGASLVNALAIADNHNFEHARRVAISVVRYLLGFALFIGTTGLLFGLTGLWRSLLGSAGLNSTANSVATVSVVLFAASITVGLWGRILLGIGRNHVTNIVLGLQAPLVLLLIWASLTFLRIHVEPVVYYVALCGVSALGYFIAARHIPSISRDLYRDALRLRRVSGAPVLMSAIPLMAQGLAAPLAFQSDRVVLTHLVDPSEVAVYAVCAQVFASLQSLVAAAGLPLWPRFAQMRQNRRSPRVWLWVGLFAGGTGLAAILIFVLSSPLFAFISNDKLTIAPAVLGAFALSSVGQAAVYPLGMLMMDEKGLRFQVVPVLLCGALSVALTFLLVPKIGIAGAPLGTAIAVITCQLVPYLLRAMHLNLNQVGGGASSVY